MRHPGPVPMRVSQMSGSPSAISLGSEGLTAQERPGHLELEGHTTPPETIPTPSDTPSLAEGGISQVPNPQTPFSEVPHSPEVKAKAKAKARRVPGKPIDVGGCGGGCGWQEGGWQLS